MLWTLIPQPCVCGRKLLDPQLKMCPHDKEATEALRPDEKINVEVDIPLLHICTLVVDKLRFRFLKDPIHICDNRLYHKTNQTPEVSSYNYRGLLKGGDGL